MIKNIILVATGGSIGATLRYLTTVFINTQFLAQFPFATLTVNTLGSFLMGMTFHLIQRHTLADSWTLFFMIGILGSFTTFSTFSLESIQLLNTQLTKGLLYIFASLVLNLLAVAIGYILIKN